MGNVKKFVAKRAHHQRQYERRVNNRQMQMQKSKINLGSALDVVLSQALDADFVVMESNRTESGMHDTSSSSGNYITLVVDENIRRVNDQVPFAEVQLTAQHNVLANEQQHTDQSKPIYDTYLLKKVDSNTSPGSTNISHRRGEIDQDVEHDQVKSPLLKAEFLKTKYMAEKEVYNELSNRFLQPEKHYFSLEISIQQKEESFQTNKPSHSRNSSSILDFKHFICSTCQKCVFNANHDDCITKFMKKVNSRTEVQSSRTKNINKPIKPKSHTQKPDRQISIGQRFSLNKSSDVCEKPNTPRSCLRWIPTGRIFKTAGLRWIPTGNMFADSTTKVDSKPLNGSNEDITNPYECKESLDVSAGTLNLSAGTSVNPKKKRLREWLLKRVIS
nr:hypothetical protein [Tanacetum cinerariifolium]